MSWRDAPLYVRSYDLARGLGDRCAHRRGTGRESLGDDLQRRAQALVCAAALALTFPDRRRHWLREADEALVALRVLARLARDHGLLSGGAHRRAAGEMAEIGRMIGGWRRRVERNRYRTQGSTSETGHPGDQRPAGPQN